MLCGNNMASDFTVVGIRVVKNGNKYFKFVLEKHNDLMGA